MGSGPVGAAVLQAANMRAVAMMSRVPIVVDGGWWDDQSSLAERRAAMGDPALLRLSLYFISVRGSA